MVLVNRAQKRVIAIATQGVIRARNVSVTAQADNFIMFRRRAIYIHKYILASVFI
jgi:hypothetical protein